MQVLCLNINMHSVYILLSMKDKRTYVGYSKDPLQRLHEHNTGRVIATKNRMPLKILLTEEFETMNEAKQRERWWKSGSGRKEMKKLFK